jgi:hypothetical protein
MLHSGPYTISLDMFIAVRQFPASMVLAVGSSNTGNKIWSSTKVKDLIDISC